MIDTLMQDLRYAALTFGRAPAFTAIAVLTIALGVGANAAIFTIVDAVLLRPLPFTSPGELVLARDRDTQTNRTFPNTSPANFLDWRARSHSFAGMTAFVFTAFTLSSGDHPDSVSGATVSANFFDVIGIEPAAGRTFRPEDEGPGAPRVAVLGYGIWQERFGGRTAVLGESVRLNDELHTIVGIMPPAIDYPGTVQIWVPPHWRVPDDVLAPGEDPSAQRGHGYLRVVARLKPGVTRQQAQADMDTIAAALERDYAADNLNVGVGLASLQDELVANARPTLLILIVAVGLVLIIAAANISGLLMTRAMSRHQEMAIRIALGATRARILRQLVTESLLLAGAGGAAGVLLAMWMVGPLAAMSPRELGVAGDVHVNSTVLLFGLGISLATGLIVGLAPGRELLRTDVHGALKQSAQSGGANQRRVRAALVASEIALSLVLLVSAGLTIKSLIRLQHVRPGFDIERVLTVGVNLPQTRYRTPQTKADFWQQAAAELGRIPGVEAAGATNRLPLGGGNSSRGLTIDGVTAGVEPAADYRSVTPGYFRALGIPILRGRAISEADNETGARVAVVSASMAQRFWPGRDPIGQRFAIANNAASASMTIVGVAGDIHHVSLEAAAEPTFYVPYRQDPWPAMMFVLRTPATAATLSNAVRDAIAHVDKDQPAGAMLTMDERLSSLLARRRFSVTLLTAFGIIAIALAAIGLYGVLAFIVAQRRREIGVRMAIGARPRDVVAGVMGEGMRLAALGIVVGLGLALAATRLITSLLYGTSAMDVATFASVAALLVAIGAAASFVPAYRASRVDPIVALRDE